MPCLKVRLEAELLCPSGEAASARGLVGTAVRLCHRALHRHPGRAVAAGLVEQTCPCTALHQACTLCRALEPVLPQSLCQLEQQMLRAQVGLGGGWVATLEGAEGGEVESEAIAWLSCVRTHPKHSQDSMSILCTSSFPLCSLHCHLLQRPRDPPEREPERGQQRGWRLHHLPVQPRICPARGSQNHLCAD